MTRSELKSAVIQYTILVALSLIFSHEISRNAYDNVWEDPVLKNLTSTFKIAILNATTPNNSTLAGNSTLGAGSTNSFLDPPESFWLNYFPRTLFANALLCPLSYYWQIYLERFFPARPRGVEINYEKNEKVDVDVDLHEIQEEQIVKRWIAQGKVRRSSLSWWNTFVKWVLDLTVGRLWFHLLWTVLDGSLRWKSPKTIWKSLISSTLIAFFTSFLSISPLASLISFIVVPASKRVVFEAGVFLVENVFISSFMRLAIPWVVRTEFVQMIMTNTTQGFYDGLQAEGGKKGVPGRLTIGDEL